MNEPTQNPQKPGLSNSAMVSLAFEMGFVIAVPAVGMSVLGKSLDGKWGTTPYMTLLFIAVAISLSSAWLYMRLKGYMKK